MYHPLLLNKKKGCTANIITSITFITGKIGTFGAMVKGVLGRSY